MRNAKLALPGMLAEGAGGGAASSAGAGAASTLPPQTGGQASAQGSQQLGVQQLGAQQPQQRRARRRASRPQQRGAQQLPPPQPSHAQSHEQPWQPWPANTVLFSPPTRAMPTTAKNIAMPKRTKRFILESSTNRYRTKKTFRTSAAEFRVPSKVTAPLEGLHYRPDDSRLLMATRKRASPCFDARKQCAIREIMRSLGRLS